MGRRPTSSTKAGRFMNPADQQRKIERRKELKRNRKQRQQVRQAVLKSKDCEELIQQMSRLDEMEYDANEKPPLPEKVIQTKREKFRETYLKVLGMYKREGENEKLAEAKKLLHAYDAERNQLLQNFIAAKFAKEANPAEIPLPGGMAMPGSEMTPTIPPPGLVQIPLPSAFPPHLILPDRPVALPAQPPPGSGILKKPALKRVSAVPPGPPSGIPPEFSDSDSDESEEEDSDVGSEEAEEYQDQEADGAEPGTSEHKGRVRFAGVEEEGEEKDSRTMYKQLAKKMAEESLEDYAQQAAELADVSDPVSSVTGAAPRPAASYQTAFAAASGVTTQPRPLGASLPPRLLNVPPPPTGPRSSLTGANRGPIGPRPPAPAPSTAAVITAEPSIISRPKPTPKVIEAKPQLRNMQKEVTKLIPTAIRVRRDLPPGGVLRKPAQPGPSRPAATTGGEKDGGKAAPAKGADDAYELFMKEMSGFM